MAKPYHPDFFAPEKDVQRPHCAARLKLIQPLVSGTVLDIGCSEGYFSFGVAPQADEVVGIDANKGVITRCKQRRTLLPDHLFEKVRFIHTEIEHYLTAGHRFNTTLYLSVHHHIMVKHGFDAAAEILFRIMENTTGTLLFDVGQKDEKGRGRGKWWHILPKSNPDKWVRSLLVAAGAVNIHRIGESKVAGTVRGLWAASR